MIYIIPFIIVLVITPVIRKYALLEGIVDKVTGDPLKIHKQPVAKLGGLSIIIAVIVGMLLAGGSLLEPDYYRKMSGLLIAAVIIFGVGFKDDIEGINPALRLFLHISAGLILLFAGIRVNFIPVPWISVLLTLLYIVGAINAVNVMDGMDGLCSGMLIIASCGFFIIGLKEGNALLAAISMILFMSLSGFLPYNLHPAKIFLGDAGSEFLGFSFGVMAVMATTKPYSIVNFMVPLLIISVPVLDLAFAILRRIIRKQDILTGDRDHFYDIIHRKYSIRKTVFISYGIQTVVVAAAVIISFLWGH